MELDIPTIIRVTENHLTNLRNLLAQASGAGNLSAAAQLVESIAKTELALDELRQTPSAQVG